MHAKKRTGISLLEVLISMFVLLVGLAGIASLLPAGRSEIMQGVKLDYAMMVGRNALRELNTRAYLNPRRWVSTDASGNGSYSTWDATDTTGNPFVLPNVGGSNRNQLPVLIDPLGIRAPIGSYGNRWSSNTPPSQGTVFITRVGIDQIDNNTYRLADSVFRCQDDLVLADNPVDRKSPPIQQATAGAQRLSNGNYSWFATVVPPPRVAQIGTHATVSVAVLYKRDLSDATLSQDAPRIVALPGLGISGGEAVVYDSRKALKPGQWVLIGGYNDAGGVRREEFRWYRVLAAGERMSASTWAGPPLASGLDGNKLVQPITLAGSDWTTFPGPGAALDTASPKPWPTMFIVDNVIAVYERPFAIE